MPAGEPSRPSADRDVLPREESSRKRESVNPVSDPTMARSEQPQAAAEQARRFAATIDKTPLSGFD